MLEIKEKNEHVKAKVPLRYISLDDIYSSKKKRKYILGRREHSPETLPLVLVGDSHLIHMST